MSDEATIHARKPRTIWPWLVVAIVLVLLATVFVPIFSFGVRFRESALKGMTPSEVIARCGPPVFGSTSAPNGGFDDIPGEPVWSEMGEAGQATLLARPEFTFGYPSSYGDRVAVRFRNGRVVRVTNTPK